jgi:heme a synthase
MVVALLIVALILYVIKKSNIFKENDNSNSSFNRLLWIAALLSILQIIIGTQVRQHVDTQIKNGVTASVLWLHKPTITFYIHRSFSIIVLLLNGYLFFQNKKLKHHFQKINWVIALIVLEIITGIAMYYFDFPFASQPIHLVIASLLFGVQWYLILETQKELK